MFLHPRGNHFSLCVRVNVSEWMGGSSIKCVCVCVYVCVYVWWIKCVEVGGSNVVCMCVCGCVCGWVGGWIECVCHVCAYKQHSIELVMVLTYQFYLLFLPLFHSLLSL